MIRLTKGPLPAVLSAKAAEWTKNLLDALASGSDDVKRIKGRYNHPSVKAALKTETAGKCAYCESGILHVTHGDIEHIVPKSSAPELTFDWGNLTLACDVCNTNKGMREGLLDPYEVDPEEQFSFYGPMLLHNPGHHVAERTRNALELNRTVLIEKRREALDAISDLFVRIEQNPDPQERALILQETLTSVTASKREFAACVRAFVNARKTATPDNP